MPIAMLYKSHELFYHCELYPYIGTGWKVNRLFELRFTGPISGLLYLTTPIQALAAIWYVSYIALIIKSTC